MKHLNTTACTKLVLSMVCVVACWGLPASAQSLAFDTGKRTTIQNEQKLSLRKALGELETKYKVVFGYQSNVVTNRYVNENNDWLYQPDAESAIRLLLGPLNLSYKRVGKDTYIIKSRKKTKMTNTALPPGTAAPDLGTFSEKNAQNDFAATLVSGTVKSDAGESLPGVSVSVKGTTSGTTTDAGGKYSISVPEQGAILVFSFIGYVTEEIVVGNRTTVDVTLIPDIKSLSEVVVVGYGTQNRKDLTGSVASVRGEELKNMPTNSLTNALQGRIPGAYITQTDGNPASGANIVIRGPVSINGGSPLYVVDGIPFQGTNFNFNVQDIESVDVLKDAAAAAIYGALGGSGVILITTKKGKSGQLRVGFNANYGVRDVFNLPQTLRRDEYIRAKEAFGFPAEDLYGPRSGWSRLPDTDWFRETYRQGRDQNYTISLSGGGEKSTFYVSTNYARIDGTRVGNWIDRYTLRLNSDHQISKRFKFSQTLYGRYGQEDPNSSTNQGDLSFRNTPVMAVYDPTNPFGGWGKLPRGFQGGHDLQAILGNFSRNESYEVTLGGTLEAKIIDGLNFRSTLGTGIVGYNNYNYNYVADIGNGPSFDDFGRFMGRDMKFIGTFTLNYDKTFGQHNIKALVGYEARRENFANVSGNNRGALVQVPQNFDLVRTVSTATMRSYAGDAFRILSQFARLEYAFKDKYLVTANLRRDGYSTKFGPDNRYGVFPGVSVGWKISEENFMRDIPLLSFLKLRAGYGVIGNASGADYIFNADYSQGWSYDFGAGGNRQNGVGISSKLPNPAIRWESVGTANFGIDGAILENRLSFNIDYYDRQTRNMIYQVGIAPSVGLGPNVQANVGQMSNRGLELNFDYKDKIGDFNYNIGVNGAFNRNRLVALDPSLQRPSITSGGLNEFYGGQQPSRSEPGRPLGQFFGYISDGIYRADAGSGERRPTVAGKTPKAGDLIYRDLDGNGVINDADRTFIGDPWPKLVYGITAGASWKGIDVRILFNGVYGNQIYNAFQSFEHMFFGDYTTTSKIFETSGFAGNGVTDKPRVGTLTDVDLTGNGNWSYMSSYHVQSGSYLRLRNIQIGYNIPQAFTSRLRMSSLRVFAMADNLFTITRYKGMNPELGSSNLLAQGIDISQSRYPMSRLFSFGINAEF